MKTRIWFIIFLVGLFAIQTETQAQQLDSLWNDFLELETRKNMAESQYESFLITQSELLQKQRQLQKNQNWFNGWIVEIRLANVNQELVEVADSIEVFEDRIQILDLQKHDYLQKFKIAYQRELDRNYAGELNSERIQILVNSVLNETLPESDLPDYDRLIHSLEHDEAIKKIVYNDLVVVLRRKMAFIDSMLTEKKQDLVLLRRLGQFHEDVLLQIEANTDVSLSGNNLTETASSDELSYASDEGYITYSESDRGQLRSSDTEMLSGDQSETTDDELISGSASSQLQNDATSINPIITDIQTLNSKREQYQIILQKLQKELAE